MSEREIQDAIQLAASQDGCLLLRNMVGGFYDRTGRFVRFGLCEGSSDLIGWTATGQFLAIEVKRPGHKTRVDRLQAQQRFIDAVQAAGGKAGFAESVEQAREIWSERP